MLNTNRSYGLPASSLPADARIASYPNHFPRGFDPQRSNQEVGTQRAPEASGFRSRSIRRSTRTSIAQRMRATNGNIMSRTLSASVRELKTELSNSSEVGPANWAATKNNQTKIVHKWKSINMSLHIWDKEGKRYQRVK